MQGVKIIYQRKPLSPKQGLHRRGFRTSSPSSIKDQSSKLFRIQANTPTFYMSPIRKSVNLSPLKPRELIPKPKRKRISYMPNSTLYKKLNVKLTLHTIEFTQALHPGFRPGARSQLRRTIDFTTSKPTSYWNDPIEAIGSSINNIQ